MTRAAFLAIPSKVAIAQTPLQNQTMPGNLTEVARVLIPIDLRHFVFSVLTGQLSLLIAFANNI